jgi:hypothetical protein
MKENCKLRCVAHVGAFMRSYREPLKINGFHF